MAHRGRAIRIDFQPPSHRVGDAEPLQNFCDVNPRRGGLGIGNKNRIGREQRGAQRVRIFDRDLRVIGADRKRRLDQADIGDRGGDDKIFFREFGDDCRRQNHDVGGRALAQFIGHGADRAEFSRDV